MGDRAGIPADISRSPETERDGGLLREYLAGRDTHCPLCGYNLRDLVGNRCPECGERITLQVNAVEPRLAAPIAGLVGLSAGAGLSGLLLVYVMIQSLLFRSFGMGEFFAINA